MTPLHGIQRSPLKYLVFAGNYREYQQWALTHGILNGAALFVADASNLSALQSVEGLTFIKIGTFHLRSDAQTIIDECKKRFPTARFWFPTS